MRAIAVVVAVVALGCSLEPAVECRKLRLIGHSPRSVPVTVSPDGASSYPVATAIGSYNDGGGDIFELAGSGVDGVIAVVVDGDVAVGVDIVSTRSIIDGELVSASVSVSEDMTTRPVAIHDALIQVLGRIGLGIDGITPEHECIDAGVELFLEANSP